MILDPLKPTGTLVMTPWGEYPLCRFEEFAFMYVYRDEWRDEICAYADAMMEEAALND